MSSFTPFIGGAEGARRNARKRMFHPAARNHGSEHPGNNDHRMTPFPKSMKPSERFFGSILSSSVTSLLETSDGDNHSIRSNREKKHEIWMDRACSLLDVPGFPLAVSKRTVNLKKNGSGRDDRAHHVMQRSCSFLALTSKHSPSPPVRYVRVGTYDNPKSYYLSRAPLILEESRSIVADALSKLSFNEGQNYYGLKNKTIAKKSFDAAVSLQLLAMEEKYTKKVMPRGAVPVILTFRFNSYKSSKILKKNTNFKRHGSSMNDLNWTRPGTVVLLRYCQDLWKDKRRKNNDGEAVGNSNNGGTKTKQLYCSGVLACVQPQQRSNSSFAEDDDLSSNCRLLSLMIFRQQDLPLEKIFQPNNSGKPERICTEFEAIPLTSLISQVRQIEACLRLTKVSFMNKLLGMRDSTHTRFGDSSDEEEEEEETIEVCVNKGVRGGGVHNKKGYEDCDGEGSTSSATEDNDEDEDDEGCVNWNGVLAALPTLNNSQERAAQKFLTCPSSSLILVQEPPGTGKSTFLVNTICRRLASDPNARLLVTAPTNRAVIVLAQRFIDVMNKAGSGGLPRHCNSVLVGVEDKLMSDSSAKDEAQYLSADSLTPTLKSIFVYSWVDTIKNDCMSILESLQHLQHSKQQQSTQRPNTTMESMIKSIANISSRLSDGAPNVCYSPCKYAKLLLLKIKAVAAAELWESTLPVISRDDLNYKSSFSLLENAVDHAKKLLEAVGEIDSNDVVAELLATARVIFCTLSTAGASIMKQTRQIHDLLIDEAAAATEPEIWIPFHLRPKRMLAVGDPNQLPPTILSRSAADLGLAKSMHERLMQECGNEYFMLDRQYRMNPCISSFPCKQFYDGKVLDGENVASVSYASEIASHSHGQYAFLNIPGKEYQECSGSYVNKEEAEAVVKLVEKISQNVSGSVVDWDSSDKIRIITFYLGQVKLLKRLLAENGLSRVLVATVDSSQGCEADVVIVSFVRSNSKCGARHAAGFLCDNRRLNVALTRARHQLICVGNAVDTLGVEGSEDLKNMVADARTRGCLIENQERI
mmetsp:Transcript_15856/g.31468  ORF Transcript_15856/g.31468 Transcript_15856/m.31468 type:complete len:1039 (-) Transcript_15856:29-3145(-)